MGLKGHTIPKVHVATILSGGRVCGRAPSDQFRVCSQTEERQSSGVCRFDWFVWSWVCLAKADNTTQKNFLTRRRSLATFIPYQAAVDDGDRAWFLLLFVVSVLWILAVFWSMMVYGFWGSFRLWWLFQILSGGVVVWWRFALKAVLKNGITMDCGWTLELDDFFFNYVSYFEIFLEIVFYLHVSINFGIDFFFQIIRNMLYWMYWTIQYIPKDISVL